MDAQQPKFVIKPFVPTPVTPTATPNAGGGGTSRTYKIVGIDADGNHSAASIAVVDVDGPVTCDLTHYDTVAWATDPANAVSVEIWLTAGAGTLGRLGTVAAGVKTFRVTSDVGVPVTYPAAPPESAAPAAVSVAPATNTTGMGPLVDVLHLRNKTVGIGGTFTGGITMQVMGTVDGLTWVTDGTPYSAGGTHDITATYTSMRVDQTHEGTGTPTAMLNGQSV